MWGPNLNSQLIELHIKEKSEELLHEAHVHQLLNQINAERPGAMQHLFHNVGDLLITLGGWLKSR